MNVQPFVDRHLNTFIVVFAILAALVLFGMFNASYAWLGHAQPPITVSGPSGSPAFIQTDPTCPAGWLHGTFSNGSTVEERCSQLIGHYVAVMYPHDKIANYGKDTAAGAGTDPTRTIDCLTFTALTDWPKDRC